MLRNFFSFRKANASVEESARVELFRQLFEFLISEIVSPWNAVQLIQLGQKTHFKKTEELFNTYLLFEKYLTTLETRRKHTRESLRELVKSRFPSIVSEPGKGSDFYFIVNLQKSNATDPDSFREIAIQKVNLKNQSAFHNKSILLAEDNSFNANIAGRFINGWGAKMDVARDGQQALEFALRKKYDLILMDVQMPILDGFECSKAIRRYLPYIPIIAVTASPINEILDMIKSSGMNDYVSKPFKPMELFSKMKTHLQIK